MSTINEVNVGGIDFEVEDTVARSRASSATTRLDSLEPRVTTAESRIDEIAQLPSGSTTGDAELADIRVAYDGTSYPNAGNSVRAQVKDTNEAFTNAFLGINNTNLVALWNNHDYTSGNMTFTHNADGSFTVSGTSGNGNRFKDLFFSTSSLPKGIKAGRYYHVKYSGATNVNFRIYRYDGSSATEIKRMASDFDGYIKIPNPCEGMIIRLWVDSNKTVNETVLPIIISDDEALAHSLKAEIEEKFLYDYGGINLCKLMNTDSYVNSYISCIPNPDGSWYIKTNGTVPNTYAKDLFTNGYKLPVGMEAGTTYFVKYSSNNVRLTIWDFSNEVVGGMLLATYTDKSFNIPSDCTGLIVRLVVPSGNSADETVTPVIMLASSTRRPDVETFVYDVTLDSCDDAEDNKIYFASRDAGVVTPSDFPINDAGWLFSYGPNERVKLQIAYPYTTGNPIKYRTKQIALSGWSNWVEIGGSSHTTTITQEVSRDTYNNTNTYNVSPTITTDSNGWLQAVDTNTADETGKTDMTPAIMAMLNSTGYCHLGPGIFYVSGNIDIPFNGTLEGCGKNTIIRLLQSVQSGYICSVGNYCTIRDIRFSGNFEAPETTGNLGGRKGIVYQRADSDTSYRHLCQISNCWFDGLDSAIYCYHTGGGIIEGLIVSDVMIYRCNAGINLDYYCEYCKFSNIVTFQCYYACINNGGNNVFIGCSFHGVVGFLIDNSGGNKSNNAHGSCVGCTFNHIDNMHHPEVLGRGLGVKLLSADHGFIFTDCQLWYGEVYVEDSPGILFANCMFGAGNPEIEVQGSRSAVMLNGCVFYAQPTITATGTVRTDACYTFNGTAVSA